MTTFGTTLRRLRRARAMSQWALAKGTGCDHSTVSRYEDGQRDPSRDMATRLADALDATPAERAELMHAAGFAVELTPEVERFAGLPVDVQRDLLTIADVMMRRAAA